MRGFSSVEMNLYLNLQTATKIVFILVTCVAFSGAALQNDDLQNKDKNKPNIIIILADDLVSKIQILATLIERFYLKKFHMLGIQ